MVSGRPIPRARGAVSGGQPARQIYFKPVAGLVLLWCRYVFFIRFFFFFFVTVRGERLPLTKFSSTVVGFQKLMPIFF